VVLALGWPGCAEISVDRFTYACKETAECGSGWVCMGELCVEEASTDGSRSLSLDFFGLTSHVEETFEVRIIDASRFLTARVVIDPLGQKDLTLVLPNLLPVGRDPHSIEFYADHDRSGSYTESPADHGWIGTIPWNATYFGFQHTPDFDDLGQNTARGPDAVLFFDEFGAEVEGHMLHAEVYLPAAENQPERLFGVYQMRPYTQSGAGRILPGILDAGIHRLDAWADMDDDQSYDATKDLAWRTCFLAREEVEGAGVTVNVDYEGDQVHDKNADTQCPEG
jgi:hypothetical protein